MKKPSEVFSSIRYAKGKSKDKPHSSTDNEEHYTVGEKEYEQQIKHVKKMAMQEQSDTMEKVEMVKSQLHFIKYACEEILEYIDMGGEVEEWYQVKVAKSFSEFESLHAFMEGESRRKGMKEEVEQLDEKNVPTNPSLWSRAKAMARSKFDVYPSAYANGWAAKWYKGKGGGWKSVNEQTENPPFEGGTKPKDKAVPGKYGKGYSTARHLARMAMKKQAEKMKKAPIKEETRKAAIVKDIMKKKAEPEDKFQANPTLTSQVQKVDNAVT